MMEEVEVQSLKLVVGTNQAKFKIRGSLILVPIGGRYNALALLLLIG